MHVLKNRTVVWNGRDEWREQSDDLIQIIGLDNFVNYVDMVYFVFFFFFCKAAVAELIKLNIGIYYSAEKTLRILSDYIPKLHFNKRILLLVQHKIQ